MVVHGVWLFFCVHRGAMRGRIMDRMRGGGGGGGLMEEERRLSSQRYLQQFKR